MKRSSLFLTELIFSLLIFIICSVVCVSLLVYSHLMSQKSQRLSDAVFLAETVAEEFKAGQPLTEPQDDYAVATETSSANGVEYLTISVSFDGDVIYTLTAARTGMGDDSP